jgi:hypothetical protein
MCSQCLPDMTSKHWDLENVNEDVVCSNSYWLQGTQCKRKYCDYVLWTGKDCKGSGHRLFQDIVPAFL